MTRITKRLRLPNVTGYILAGILMGPCCLNVIPQSIIDGTDFLSDVALAFIAFSAGEFFKIDVLKRNGAKVIVITVLEACLASVAVFALVYGVLHLELSFSIVLAGAGLGNCPRLYDDDHSPDGRARRFCGYAFAGGRARRCGRPDSVQCGDFRCNGVGERPYAACHGDEADSGEHRVLALGALFGVMLKLLFPQAFKR